MPTDTELIEQLADYGSWLARRAGVEPDGNGSMVAPAIEVSPTSPVTEGRGARRRRRGRVVVTAAAAAMFAIAGVAVLQDRGSPDSSVGPEAALPGEEEALFLLPPADHEATNGYVGGVGEATEGTPTEAAVLGRPVPGGHVAVILATVFDEQPELFGEPDSSEPGTLDESLDVERTTISRNFELIESPVQSTVLRRSGDWWLQLTAGAGLGDWLAARARQIHVDADGTVSPDPDSAFEVVTTFTIGLAPTTYMEIRTPDGLRVVAETIGSTGAPVLGASWLGEVTVRGRQGWAMLDDWPVEPQVALVWNETPDRAVALSGHAITPEELVAVAEELRIVDEETWSDATGATEPPPDTSET